MVETNDDRRRHPRSKRGFLGLENKADPGVLNQVENISCSGILCYTSAPIEEMTKMSIALELPDPINKEIHAEGIVVRCDADDDKDDVYRVAILYTKLDGDDLLAIKEFVESDKTQ